MFVYLDDFDLVVPAKMLAQSRLCEQRAFTPLGALGIPSEIFKHIGICGEELWAPAESLARVELGNLELEERLLRLAEVEPCARHRDGQLHTLLGIQLAELCCEACFNAPLGATQSALALDHQREVPL